ncbi:MAG: hypothetical protein KC996_08005 [Phycisphaerales bacterium]|nr:hypothetical protein [Phycisphaerales bacterium]
MTPPDKYDTGYRPHKSDTRPAPDPFERWTLQKGYESANRLRLPLVLASSRLKLGSRRCDELQSSIDELNDRLLNASPLMPFEHRSELERRVLQVETALHNERLSAWKDLLPLTREMKDAAIEELRSGFLNEFARLVGDGKHAEERRTP